MQYTGQLSDQSPFATASPFHTDAQRSAPPGYSVMIWALGKLDPAITPAAKCLAKLKARCTLPFAFQLVVAIQLVAAFGCLALIFFISWQACGGREAAILALLLAAVFARFGSYVTNLEPYIIFSFLFLAFVALSVWAINQNNLLLAFSAGIALAIAALFHTPCVLLIPIMIAAFALSSKGKFSKQATSTKLPLLFALGAIAPLIPICIHNFIAFGDPMLTVGYETELLRHRVGFNNLTMTDWLASWVRWFPIGGSAISDLIFGSDAGLRLEKFKPGSYRYLGHEWLLAQPGDMTSLNTLKSLIGSQIQPLMGEHLAASLVLFFKHYWLSGSFIAIPALYFMPTVLRISAHRKEPNAIVIIIIACIGMLVIQSLLDFRSPRIGLPLILLPCCIMAYITRGI